MTDRCETTFYPNGGYCVHCDEQEFIPYIPEHVEEFIDTGWNAGANSIDYFSPPILLTWKVSPNPGGVVMGLYNGFIDRDEINPASLDVAIYTYAGGGGTLAVGQVGGIAIGLPFGVSSADEYSIQWIGDSVEFRVNGVVKSRATVTSIGLLRWGASLYLSGDSVIDANATVPTTAGAYGEGSNAISFNARGSQVPNFGSSSMTFTAVGDGKGGSARISFGAGGAWSAGFGTGLIVFRAAGAGMEQPHPSYGSALLDFSTGGDLHIPIHAEGYATMSFLATGNESPDFGSATMSFVGGGGNLLEGDYIIGLMSGGTTQLTFGYEKYVLSDTLTLSDQVMTSLRILMRDALRLADSIGTNAAIEVLLVDTLKLSDKMSIQFKALLADTLNLTDAFKMRLNLRALADRLVLTDQVATTLQAYQLIASVLSLADTIKALSVVQLEDELQFTDAITATLAAKHQLIDALTLTDSLTGTGQFVAVMSDTLELGDNINTTLDAIARMHDQINFACRLYTDNGEYIAYAFNTETEATTKYENYRFNSFAEINGVLLGASETGLYNCDGDTDDGANIDAHVTTGADNLGITAYKKLVKSYLHFRSDGTMLVSVIHTSNGERQTETYRATPILAEDFRETNVDIGQGIKSVFFAFTIANENGSNFDFDGLYTIPLICGKRSNG